MQPDWRNKSIEYRREYVGAYEGYPLKNPYYEDVPIKKPLDQRITEYLDKCGVLNENMRKDITAMIKEEEKQ